jgi:predicted MFS family arabinose efflux permease
MNLVFIGPALGSFLYSVGGFTLPFLVVGTCALVMAIVLCMVVPPVKMDERDADDTTSKSLTFATLARVSL